MAEREDGEFAPVEETPEAVPAAAPRNPEAAETPDGGTVAEAPERVEDTRPTLVRRPVYEVKLDAFEGPLDLLLHLIREHEIDIYDIPIAVITEQYLEYISFVESLDLALAGEFLEMAATLIRIKVRMLLPPAIDEEEDQEDPRRQLVEKLLEYRKFKEAASHLSGREEERKTHFQHGVDLRAYREIEEETADTEEILRDVTLFDLVDVLRDVLARVPRRVDVHAVDLEETTVEEQIERVRSIVAERGSLRFRDLLASAATRSGIVTTFIALLELIKMAIVRAVQERAFGEIHIELRTEE